MLFPYGTAMLSGWLKFNSIESNLVFSGIDADKERVANPSKNSESHSSFALASGATKHTLTVRES